VRFGSGMFFANKIKKLQESIMSSEHFGLSFAMNHKESVILSAAKNLKAQILRCAQDDNFPKSIF